MTIPGSCYQLPCSCPPVLQARVCLMHREVGVLRIGSQFGVGASPQVSLPRSQICTPRLQPSARQGQAQMTVLRLCQADPTRPVLLTDSHCTDKETEAQRSQVTQPGARSWLATKPGHGPVGPSSESLGRAPTLCEAGQKGCGSFHARGFGPPFPPRKPVPRQRPALGTAVFTCLRGYRVPPRAGH